MRIISLYLSQTSLRLYNIHSYVGDEFINS